jgi:hypothetical protein
MYITTEVLTMFYIQSQELTLTTASPALGVCLIEFNTAIVASGVRLKYMFIKFIYVLFLCVQP